MPGPREPRCHVKFNPKRKGEEANVTDAGGGGEKAPGPPKPEIKLSDRPSESGSKVWVVVGLVAMMLLAAYALGSWVKRPDPHYVTAREIVDRYEKGREATSRNYNNTVYDQALAELKQVDPASISAEPARKLTAEILHGREAFLARREEVKRERSAKVGERWERIERNLESHERAMANPVTEYPECDDEEKAGHEH